MELAGSVVAVTGAARGIGRATATAFARAGARGVALVDVKADELADAAAEVAQAGAEALALEVDVSDLASLRGMFAEIDARFGRLDVLHNNAGLGEGPPDWPGIAPERSAAIIDVNLRGVILGTQLALPLMQRGGGGVIVATSSGGAFVPLPPQAVYVATKAAVVHFTKSCVPLHESHGVRVNCICPGLVDTQMVQETGEQGVAPWLRPLFDSVNLLTPADIGEAVLQIARDDSLVGEVVHVGNEG